MKRLHVPIVFILICFASIASAQDEPRAAWQITKFDITASAPATERALTVRAQLMVRNVGRGAGTTLSLRINPKAEIKSASVGGSPATFRTAEESFKRQERVLLTLQRFTINLPAPVAPNGNVSVVVDYRLPITENSGLTAISPVGSQFLPASNWYPVASATYSLRGADVAPLRLSLSNTGGEITVASGKANGATFENALNAQPFFLSGNWDVSEGTGDARGVSAFLSKGAGAEERKQAEALMSLAASARSFYASLLGNAPDAPIRLVSVARGAGFNDAGTLLLDTAAFRRGKIDSATAMLIGEAVARLWVGGVAPVRSEGRGVIGEGLVRYLATLFIEKHFGRETSDAERARQRVAYSSIAKLDSPLAQVTPLDGTYYNSAGNKGAMIWRLVERALGRDPLMNLLRSALSAGASEGGEGLTLSSLRAMLAERGGASLKALLDQEIDQPTDMDLMIGLPQQRGPQWSVALRNTGAVEASVQVAATTATGERLMAQTTIPARSFSDALFTTGARIVRVEVDPEKLYPQIDYTNDIAPRPTQSAEPLGEAASLFVRQNYAGVETAARALLALSPGMQEARILLARSLLALNKTDEAEKEFRALLDTALPTPATLAWANIGLAEISLRKGQAGEAARRFNEAARVDAEYASTLSARQGRIKAEMAANALPAIDESVRTFITQLDVAIKSGRKTELDAVILPGELVDFVKGIIGSQPESWQTRVVRAEMLDANRAAVDVQITARQFGRDMAGTAVLMLARLGANWRLAGIEFFEVR